MIAVIFALPQESRAFRRALRHAGRSGVPPAEYLLGNLGDDEVIVLHTGVGDEAATRRTEALLAAVRPRWVIGAGFAGALDSRLRAGDLIVATNVTHPVLLERARAVVADEPGVFFGPVVGAQFPIEEPSEKAELGRMSGGMAVDMETAAMAGASARARVPFLAVRAITDAAAEPLPLPFSESYDLAHQRPRPVRVLRYLAHHPRQIIPFMRFVQGLAPASAALRDFLGRFIAAGDRRRSERDSRSPSRRQGG